MTGALAADHGQRVWEWLDSTARRERKEGEDPGTAKLG